MQVYLWGMMGSGKSTVAPLLARQLGLESYDLDEYLEEAEGMTIYELFERNGQDAFREKEQKALHEMMELGPAVISCGGGTPCYFDNADTMKASGLTCYLATTVDTLAGRLEGQLESRPLLKGQTPTALLNYLAHMLLKRESFYKSAEVIIDTEDKKPQDIADEIARSLLHKAR